MGSKLRSNLRGRHFGNNDEIICVVAEFLVGQDATFRDVIATILKNSEKLLFFLLLLGVV